MWCHSAQTPQVTILTADDHIEAGVKRKFAYDQDYQNLTLGFYIDQDFKVKRFFDQWKQAIVSQKRYFGYPDDYTAPSLILSIINSQDEVTYTYEYTNIFPKSVNSVDLSYSSGTQVSTFTVDFVFEDVFYSSVKDKNVTYTSKPVVNIGESSGSTIANAEVYQGAPDHY